MLRTARWCCAAWLALGACDAPEQAEEDSGSQCVSAKCDVPSGDAHELCSQRQSEVLDSTQRGFSRDAIRWACADVAGVTTEGGDSRGQEYCEYYAVVQAPSAEQGTALGRLLDGSGEVTALGVCIDEDGAQEDCGLTLTEDELFAWEDAPEQVVGSCVFTSWHPEVPGPLPACDADGCLGTAHVHGLSLDVDHARMKRQLNGNGAASSLVRDCVTLATEGKTAQPQDWSEQSDPLTEPFFRGCVTIHEQFGTGWRRSDSSVCAVANRLVECGCSIPGVEASKLGEALVPPQPTPDGEVTLRGFPLGGWEGPTALPGGCRYAEIGEDSQVVVLCDLTAADVLGSRADPKGRCRELYGNQVVVHVPLPADDIACEPPDTPAGASCSATPWNIGA